VYISVSLCFVVRFARTKEDSIKDKTERENERDIIVCWGDHRNQSNHHHPHRVLGTEREKEEEEEDIYTYIRSVT
jgi:hypothetical protein